MAKFNRRLLLSGFVTGLTGAAIADSVSAQPAQRPIVPRPRRSDEDIEVIWGDESEDGSISRPPTQPATGVTTQPTVAYDRKISSLLIRCSHLGLEQFAKGQQDAAYNGSIRVLESYWSDLDRYSQVASFRVKLDPTTTLLPNLGELGNQIVRRVIRPSLTFSGFALTSTTENIVVFRGTSNPKEWIANLQARQSDYVSAGTVRGQVHTGFLRLYEQLSAQVRAAAKQFNAALPCYVAGHSLGGALATLAAVDLAQTSPALKPQLQVYSYAAPRIGDLAFAKFVSAIAPTNFRVFNYSDIVPMVPPSNLRAQDYSHVGQEWMFLDYAGGDVAACHATASYQRAIAQQLETNQMPQFPTACKA